VKEKRFKSGEQWEVLRREEGAVIIKKDGVEKHLPLDEARKFSVFERENINIAIGDRVRFTKNAYRAKYHGSPLPQPDDQRRSATVKVMPRETTAQLSTTPLSNAGGSSSR